MVGMVVVRVGANEKEEETKKEDKRPPIKSANGVWVSLKEQLKPKVW